MICFADLLDRSDSFSVTHKLLQLQSEVYSFQIYIYMAHAGFSAKFLFTSFDSMLLSVKTALFAFPCWKFHFYIVTVSLLLCLWLLLQITFSYSFYNPV